MLQAGICGFSLEMKVLGHTYVPTVGFSHTQPSAFAKPYKGGSSIKFQHFYGTTETMKGLILL